MNADTKRWAPQWRTTNATTELGVDRGEASLVSSASSWMQEALEAWLEDDHRKVAALAPLAIEHLGKAVLWRASPVLLLPLSRDAEHALFVLATKPDLNDRGLKTIGLSAVLDRLVRLLDTFPVDNKARSRMANVRNGAVHVGTVDLSRDVLLDALKVCQALLTVLEFEPSRFYGEHERSVTTLLDEQRGEIGRRVAARRAKAARDLAAFEERLGARFADWAAEKELEAEEMTPRDHGNDLWGIEQRCPECDFLGRLFGRIEVEALIQDNPPIDDQTPDDVQVTTWTIDMFPEAFECCVCQLILSSPEELAESGLPSDRHAIPADDLGYDFDAAAYAASRYMDFD